MFLFGYILGIMDMNLNNVFFRYLLKGFGQTDRIGSYYNIKIKIVSDRRTDGLSFII